MDRISDDGYNKCLIWIENKTCNREVDIYEQSNRNRPGNNKQLRGSP